MIHKINDGQKGKEETDGNLGPGCMVSRSGATKCAGKPILTRGGISIRERRQNMGDPVSNGLLDVGNKS